MTTDTAVTRPLIVIIDDDDTLTRMLSLELEAAGYDVQVAKTAAEGMALIKEQSPALALLDFHLSDADGLTVLNGLHKTAKKQPDWQLPPILMMTNAYEVDIMNKAMELGVHDYILKSDVRLDDIVKMVATYVAPGRAGAQNSAQAADS